MTFGATTWNSGYGDAAAGAGFPRHLVGVRLLPVPALESAGLIVIGATGLAALPFAPAGAVFTWFLASYAIMRFGLEALRGDRRPHFLGLSVNRWMCVTEITVALAIGAWPLDRREWALASFLGAALVACVVLRRARDDRRRLFAARHLDELRRTVAELAAGVGEQPLVARTSAGAAVAVSRDIRMRCSNSRTLVKYCSRRSRSRALTVRCKSFACPATASRMVWPVSSLRTCASVSAFVPCRNIRRKTSAAFSSHGISTPEPVHDRLRRPCCTLTPSVSDGKRVRCPMRSPMYWSSEMVLRKPPLPGCGAAVRKQLSAG